MKLGASLPQMDGIQDPIATRDFAQAVEGLGFDHLVVYEHVVGADPEDRPEGWRRNFTHKTFIHEPLVLFGYLGAVTTTLQFVSEIIILPQRQTVLFAKQAAEADYLTGGRLRLGFGAGWNAIEFESLNESFHNRGRRMAEQIEVMRALWTQEVVEFKGRYHTLDRVGITPMPVQRPIPVWLGGYADAVLRRVAASADGWMPLRRPSDPELHEMLATLRRYTHEAGRNEGDLGLQAQMGIAAATPEDWKRELEEWRALGATHVAASTGGLGPESVGRHIELLTAFREVAETVGV